MDPQPPVNRFRWMNMANLSPFLKGVLTYTHFCATRIYVNLLWKGVTDGETEHHPIFAKGSAQEGKAFGRQEREIDEPVSDGGLRR